MRVIRVNSSRDRARTIARTLIEGRPRVLLTMLTEILDIVFQEHLLDLKRICFSFSFAIRHWNGFHIFANLLGT